MTYYVTPPPSANNLFFNGKKGRVKSTEYRLWQTTAGLQLNIQRARPCIGQVAVDYSVPRNNRRDLGNYEKALSDLVVKHGVISDDRRIGWITLRWHDDDDHVRIDVTEMRPVDACESGAESRKSRSIPKATAGKPHPAQSKTKGPA